MSPLELEELNSQRERERDTGFHSVQTRTEVFVLAALIHIFNMSGRHNGWRPEVVRSRLMRTRNKKHFILPLERAKEKEKWMVRLRAPPMGTSLK